MLEYEEIEPYVFVTKLAGFEHTEYIQPNATHEPKSETDIPMVQGKNIRNGKFVDKYDWYISKEISESLPRSTLKKDCILIPYVGSNLGEVGVFYHTKDCHLASNVAKIELTSDAYNIEYLKYYFQSPIGQSYLFQTKQGSAQPNITMESIRKTKVIKRDLPTQKKIADVLSCIDDKIALNNKTNTELENMAKTIYDYWFTQFDFPDKNGHPYKTSGGQMVYNETLKREIPTGWDVKLVEDFCNIFTGKKDVKMALDNGKYKFFSCAPEYRYSNEKIYDGKAILVSGNGSYTGRTILVNEAFDLYQRTYACTSKSEDDILEYIYLHFLRVLSLKVGGGTHGSAIPYIVYDDLAKEPISFDKDIINQFLNLVNPIFTKIQSITKQNEELTKLRDYLLPLLMNGQITIN